MSLPYTEQALLLGGRKSLVGIVARPLMPPPVAGPAVVILNTGIVHRVGHHRMFVTLSRHLATAGCTVLRFDFSGIGDSAHRPGPLSPIEAGMADIGEALDWLAKSYGASRVILVGLCSGADQAVLYGWSDPRVEGLVLLDPTIPPTLWYYFHYVAQRLTSLRNWLSVMTGRSGLLKLFAIHLRHGIRPSRSADWLTPGTLQFSPHLARCYEHTVGRGMRLLVALTAVSPRQAYQKQILDAFPALKVSQHLQLENFPGSDHVFSAREDRVRLERLILDWLSPALSA